MTERATPGAQVMSDHHVRRHPVYREMKDRLKGEIAEREAENGRLLAGLLPNLKPTLVREIPLFRELRDRHNALKRENEELRKQLREALPSRYAIQKSEEYRKLRGDRDELREEVRSARLELKKSRWAEEVRVSHRGRAAWAIETLNQLLPDRAFEPAAMVDWHLEQATLWADLAKLPLSALTSRLRYMREDGLDPHRNHREEHGYVPAALRLKLLHEYAQCAHCEAENDLTIDHVLPLLHGGTSAEENLQVLCRSCNSKKGARLA